ncbi:MAG: histidinol-phosphate transaminase [Gammaproteobacteria bacterium]
MNAAELARPEVRALDAYVPEATRSGVLLDANELPAGIHNRYPDPDARALTAAFARYYGVRPLSVLATRGSDDGIDALSRAFLTPGTDAVLVTPPTFAMFGVFARLQGADVVELPLAAGFAFDRSALAAAWRPGVKLVYICSPNNPTGTVMPLDDIAWLCKTLAGRALVVVDEAYQEFSTQPSAVPLLEAHANLVVLRTLSKAFGLAAIRCGALLAAPEIITLVRRVLPPYLLPAPVVDIAQAALAPAAVAAMQANADAIRARRQRCAAALMTTPGVAEVVGGEANFVLVRFANAVRAYARLEGAGIRVRRFDGALADWLRITIGTEEEVAGAQAALR